MARYKVSFSNLVITTPDLSRVEGDERRVALLVCDAVRKALAQDMESTNGLKVESFGVTSFHGECSNIAIY